MCIYLDKIHLRQKKPTWKIKLILLIYYFYHEGTIFYLHVPTYLLFPKRESFTLVKLEKDLLPTYDFIKIQKNLQVNVVLILLEILFIGS